MKPADARSREQLTSLVDGGARPDYVLFWGHIPKVSGIADSSCLSNWFPATFTLEGLEYPTTEHYMMAEKARLFGDEAVRAEILKAGSPDAAKKLGRQVANFDDAVWLKHRIEIVVRGNLAKFQQNMDLGGFLLATGDKVLVEASPRDTIWGIGLGRENERSRNPAQWRGLNLLGFALMETRARLQRPATV